MEQIIAIVTRLSVSCLYIAGTLQSWLLNSFPLDDPSGSLLQDWFKGLTIAQRLMVLYLLICFLYFLGLVAIRSIDFRRLQKPINSNIRE